VAQMQTFQRWIVFGLLALSSPSYADGISGTYVGRGSNSVFLVQLVETNGGQLTGRYEQTLLQPNGKLEQMNASITGASDGRTVVVTIKPTELLSGSFTASGTIEGSALHLSGGGYGSTLTLNLTKSEESAFRSLVEDLTNQSHQIIATRALQEEADRRAKAQADLLTLVKNLTQKMTTFSATTDGALRKFAPVEERYKAITEWMRAAHARQRSIYGDGQASVARSQIGVSINQAGKRTCCEVSAMSAMSSLTNSGNRPSKFHAGCIDIDQNKSPTA